HTQHEILPLIQISDFAGALGLSFLIVLFNAWLVELRTRPLFDPAARSRLAAPQFKRLVFVGALFVLVAMYGEFRILTAQFHDGPKLALIQSDIEQGRKKPSEAEAILATYKSLIERVLRGSNQPDLIVWPETSFPYPYV